MSVVVGRRFAFIGVILLLVLCGQGSPTPLVRQAATSQALAASTEKFDLEALIAAAKKEPPLVTLNNSGVVTDIVANFIAKYGIKAFGTKTDSAAQVEQVVREVRSGNVKLGVLSIEDGALVQGRLIPQRVVDNWVPPDMVNSIPKEWQNPLVQIWDAKVVAYNPEAYSICPITNIWDLTDPRWRGKVALRDPLQTPEEITWFSWLTSDDNAEKLAAAYQRRYGRALQTKEKNAGYEFIARLAANQPILTKSDNDSASSVGAPGQKDAPIGIMSLGKFAEAPPKGQKLAPCKSIRPWIGYAYPRYAVIVHNTPSPNAAKVYIHYLMTAEGAAPTIDQHGGFSANKDVPPGQNEYLGSREFWERNLIFLAPRGNARAWQMREILSDLWQLNHQ